MRNPYAVLPPRVICAAALAFDSPTGTAGPLTVRWQAPALGACGGGGPDGPRGGGGGISAGAAARHAAATSGAVRLERQGEALTVTPAPEGQTFQVRLHWSQLPWKLATPRQAEALREDGSAAGAAAVQRDGDDVLMECAAGVFACRLK